MTPNKLTAEELQQFLDRSTVWSAEDDSISRSYAFNDFSNAMEFVNALARAAEDVQHHPDIDIRYNKVKITLSTHDAGGVTSLDTNLGAVADDYASVITKK